MASFVSLLKLKLGSKNLRGADLSGLDLRKVDLEKVDLTGARLDGCNLRGARMNGSNLTGASFFHADLRAAQLCGADLERAKIRGCNLAGADFTRADLRRINLAGQDLQAVNFTRANLTDAILAETDLRGSILSGVVAWNLDLSGADARGADFGGAILDGAKCDGADLSRANLVETAMIEASLIGTKLWEAELMRCKLGGAELKGVKVDMTQLDRRQFARFQEYARREAERDATALRHPQGFSQGLRTWDDVYRQALDQAEHSLSKPSRAEPSQTRAREDGALGSTRRARRSSGTRAVRNRPSSQPPPLRRHPASALSQHGSQSLAHDIDEALDDWQQHSAAPPSRSDKHWTGIAGLDHAINTMVESWHEAAEQVAAESKQRQQQQLDPTRTYLDVPYEEKDQAKALGACWDSHAQRWFVPAEDGEVPQALQRWLPAPDFAEVQDTEVQEVAESSDVRSRPSQAPTQSHTQAPAPHPAQGESQHTDLQAAVAYARAHRAPRARQTNTWPHASHAPTPVEARWHRDALRSADAIRDGVARPADPEPHTNKSGRTRRR